MTPKKNPTFPLLIILLHLFLMIFIFHSKLCTSTNIITSTNFITDPSTLLSHNRFFELGFFTSATNNTTTRHVGIWLNQGPNKTVTWVANREKPLTHTSGVFTISNDGNLVVLDGKSNKILWTSNISKPAINSTALLSDSGNLVLRDSVSGSPLWESFEHPSHALLPTMKFVTNTITKEKTELTSWKTPGEPSKGRFLFGIDAVNDIPEAYIWEGGDFRWRSGPWNGQSFIGIPQMDSVSFLHGFNLLTENRTYTLSVPSSNDFLEFEFYELNSEGNFEQWHWNVTKNDWEIRWSAVRFPCDSYGRCGGFGICDSKLSPVCSCLKGFRPKNEEEWNRGNWGNGCVRNRILKCEEVKNVEQGKEDGFWEVKSSNLPHFAESLGSSVSGDDCRVKCLENCSCSAYAFEKGIGCMIWSGKLIDTRNFAFGGASFYLRLSHSELEDNAAKRSKKIIIASLIAGIGTLIIIFITCVSWRRIIYQKAKRERKGKKMSLLNKRNKILNLTMDHRIGINLNQELPTYDFEKLAIATNNFHLDNKLGKGGFGPVYKGRLVDGQEIAIKRLSRASNQGVEEFINEVSVISKLQHRNLVRLFGYSVEGEEKMLIYEYMPNLSLDAFIFDSSKQKLLDWKKRFIIILGIARGLLYLHKDSILKIIHGDLKAGNILLDENFNPKISDFGMARIFGNNEDRANTLRVVGTYGYMSPEYAMEGHFSEKSDVFSFGVLLLEIISGRKNSSFYNDENVLSLLGLAWKLWNEENLISLIDEAIYEPSHDTEILRCIHVGLLCVQEAIKDRPNMVTILSMLSSEIMDLYPPKQPGFSSMQFDNNSVLSQHSEYKYSVNMVTITKIGGR